MENVRAQQWAVITGASSGLGAVFADRLARRGLALVLTGRDNERLAAVARQVEHDVPGTTVDVVTADLATTDGIAALAGRLVGRQVELLVNNAGFGTHGRFGAIDPGREAGVVAVDVAAVVALTHAVLPGMITSGRGGVINVASTIAFQPAPFQAVYGASKAFVLSYTHALRAELRGTGVTATTLCPGPVHTGFGAQAGFADADAERLMPKPLWVEADEVARAAVDGMEARRAAVG